MNIYWNPFRRFFQFLGLNLIDLNSRQNSIENKLLRAYAFLITGFLLISIYYRIVSVYDKTNNTTLQINILIDDWLTIVILFTHFIAVIELHFMISEEVIIFKNFNTILLFIQRNLRVSVNGMHKKYAWKSIVSFIIIATFKFSAIVTCIEKFWPFLRYVYVSWHLIHMHLIQISIYVDILTDILNMLKENVLKCKDQCEPEDVKFLLTNIHLIYLKCVQTNEIINYRFSYSLIVILAQHVLGITNGCYWIIINLSSYQSLSIFSGIRSLFLKKGLKINNKYFL